MTPYEPYEPYQGPGGVEPVSPDRIAVVTGGTGARGAYEAGALSVLVPRLRLAGCAPRVYVGTGIGALTAVQLVASAHLPPADQARRIVELWRAISVSGVYRSPLLSLPGVAGHAVGQLLRLPGVRLTHLLDTAPLRRLVQDCDFPALRRNIAEQGVTLAVVTSCGNDDRTAVFVDRDDGVPVPAADDERPLDYIGVHTQPEHVLASSAVPVLFPPVRVVKPSGAPGWYLDGRLRLSAPLKPAIALGADAMLVAGVQPLRDTTTTPHAGGLAPDVDDILMEFADGILADRVVEDLRSLDKVNALLIGDAPVSTATGRLRRKIPYVFVGPARSRTLARLALGTLRRRSHVVGSPLQRMRQRELRLIARALAGDGPRRGALVGLLYFDPEFIRASIELGQRDAGALLDGLAVNEIPWRIS